MNFVGHIRVALDQVPAERVGVLVGAALPDLAAMGRFRLLNPSNHRDVAAGVSLHHRTDDAFHGHPWFRHHNGTITAALQDAGLSRGAARACGHVGVELLLDGYLLDTDRDLQAAAGRALASVTDDDLDLSTVVAAEHRTDWDHHLRRTAAWPLPDDYRRPEAVARRLQRILERRPRLRFEPDLVPDVSAVLAAHQAGIEHGASDLLADVAETVGPAAR